MMTSIRTKLTLLSCSSAAAALLMACVGFGVNGVQTLRAAKFQQLADRAQLVAFYSGPALTLRDSAEGERVLASLQADTTIEGAWLFDRDKRIVAKWGQDADKPFAIPSHPHPHPRRLLLCGHMDVVQPVTIAGQDVGTLYVRANASDLQRQAGCAGYLTKPIEASSLVATLESLLNRSPGRHAGPLESDKPAGRPGQSVEAAIRSELPIDDPEFAEIMSEFVSHLRVRVNRMQAAAEVGSAEDLVFHGHWLRGAGGTAGFPMLTQPARELEQLAREGRLKEASEVLAKIQAIVRRIDSPRELPALVEV